MNPLFETIQKNGFTVSLFIPSQSRPAQTPFTT